MLCESWVWTRTRKDLGNLETPSSTNLGQFQGLTEEAV